MSRIIRIGTRDSKLALWQAHHVAELLGEIGIQTELIMMKSEGDLDLVKPLHELGTVGLFTKTLDKALLENKVDIAVHSLKDYPTNVPAGLVLAAHLDRADPYDLFLPKGNTDWMNNPESAVTIGTGSIRRKAQWLNQFPHHTIDNLRGNVQTRLSKLEANDWSGIIMAAAGLDRMESVPEDAVVLDWMIPAPAQGVIGIVCREDDAELTEALAELDVETSRISSTVERQFLNKLEGGCSAPIGALAVIHGDHIYFSGCLVSLDGKEIINIEEVASVDEWQYLGAELAEAVLSQGGQAIIDSLRHA